MDCLQKSCEDFKPVYQSTVNYVENDFHFCQSCLMITLKSYISVAFFVADFDNFAFIL